MPAPRRRASSSGVSLPKTMTSMDTGTPVLAAEPDCVTERGVLTNRTAALRIESLIRNQDPSDLVVGPLLHEEAEDVDHLEPLSPGAVAERRSVEHRDGEHARA